MYFDQHGNPISEEEWTELHENAVYRQVGYAVVGDYLVSTVWLGRDPLFETRVFKGVHELDQVSYATLGEALIGHAKTVEKVRSE